MDIKPSSNGFSLSLNDASDTGVLTFDCIEVISEMSSTVSLKRFDSHLITLYLREPKAFWDKVSEFSIPVHALNKDVHPINFRGEAA